MTKDQVLEIYFQRILHTLGYFMGIVEVHCAHESDSMKEKISKNMKEKVEEIIKFNNEIRGLL